MRQKNTLVEAVAVIMTGPLYVIPQNIVAEDKYAKLCSLISRKT